MERFCDELRLERERRNVSIDEICAVTKVSPRHLHALEAGEYRALPGGVFRKGIVRGYLRYLNSMKRRGSSDLKPACERAVKTNRIARTGLSSPKMSAEIAVGLH